MINKISDSVAQALAGVKDGATVLIGGFGTAGIPDVLIDGLLEQGARDLTVVNNNAGNADYGVAALLKAGRVRKVICSFPRQVDSYVFDDLYRVATTAKGRFTTAISTSWWSGRPIARLITTAGIRCLNTPTSTTCLRLDSCRRLV